MPLLPPTHPSLTHLRSFSSTCTQLAKSTKQRLKFEHAAVPPYPYGPSAIYKQSNFGLYGTAKIRYGNMVSEKNEIKTRRYWRPNVHFKRLWSEALEQFVRIRITTQVLRTVDKCGGLDEYLLGEKAQRIKELGMGGWKLRWRIMQTERVKERYRKQREALGLPALPADSVAPFASEEVVESFIREYDAELAKDVEVGIGEGMEGEGEMLEEEVVGDAFMEEQPARRSMKDGKCVEVIFHFKAVPIARKMQQKGT
ncbi:54S ribosomal protein, mitochondrial [Lachnellula hyalina]|uniref:Large ribosomal subunit protein bL28m n=1 Tax=Lachnellula hyalina TaxID=1316788 RepID=A0A8H8QSZ0_9HELO|nr:54S ribosomal protein, mitochondrial [Lachnellula hyalina]TVY22217.1 54S ribosomal protein, mitochondrial [Lachnellula hyalina]